MRIVTKIIHIIVPLYFLIYVYRFYGNYLSPKILYVPILAVFQYGCELSFRVSA